MPKINKINTGQKSNKKLVNHIGPLTINNIKNVMVKTFEKRSMIDKDGNVYVGNLLSNGTRKLVHKIKYKFNKISETGKRK